MQLKNKIITILLGGWIAFAGLLIASAVFFQFTSFNHQNDIYYITVTGIALSLFFLLSILMMMAHYIFKPIKNINQSIPNNKIDSKSLPTNELQAIQYKIDYLLKALKKSDEQIEKNVTEQIKMLEQENDKLQKEVTEHRLIERELIIHKEHLIRLAHYDNLTSLPNRVFFNEILNKAINQAKRHDNSLALLFINLDHFKKINTAFDHRVGDRVLKELANRFIGQLRSGDIIARLGSDEFILLINDIEQAKYAGPVAEKILSVCEQPLKIDTQEIKVTASIGIAIYPTDGESLEELQKNADIAMYKAKQNGGNTFQFYRQEMHSAVHEHIKLETALRNAIKNKEFVLYFQPQLNLATGVIKSVEALIRWQHPELGLLGPDKFIPAAEETGMIVPIGEWALREACRIAKKWQDSGYDPIIMAVNISPKQFHHQDVAQIVKEVLEESKLDAKYLQVEITESAVMDNVDIVIAKLNSIHNMGVSLAIDDFGTGYTSINYLKKFPVNVLKIDQSFVKGIPNKQNDVAITSTIISLGHNLGLTVVAEGVETTEQMRFLAEHNCDVIQGYFISRPLNENKIKMQLSKRGVSKDKIIQK